MPSSTAAPGSQAAPAAGVALVGGQTITKAQVDEIMAVAQSTYKSEKKAFPKPGTKAYMQLRDQAVGYLVSAAIYDQAAAELGVTVTAQDVAAAIAQLRQRSFGGSEQKLKTTMKAQGLTQAGLEQNERETLIAAKIKTKLAATVEVTDAEARTYYDSHESSYPASRTVRHILVRTKALADTLYAQLKRGAGFAALAKKYSTDTATAAQGGKLTISNGETVANFDRTAFSLATGELSTPIHTQYGWDIIQALTPTKSQKPFTEVMASIKAKLLGPKLTAAVNKWKTAAITSFCAGKVSYLAGYEPTTANDPCPKNTRPAGSTVSTSTSTASTSTASTSTAPTEPSSAPTIDVPDDVAAAFQKGAANGQYVFYAIAGHVPDWKSVAAAGVFICSQSRPPLIPATERGEIDSGALQPGTLVTLKTKDIVDALGIKQLLVTVPAAVKGCTGEALKRMSATPGTLLMTDANASFAEKSQLVKVMLK